MTRQQRDFAHGSPEARPDIIVSCGWVGVVLEVENESERGSRHVHLLEVRVARLRREREGWFVKSLGDEQAYFECPEKV